MHPFSLSLTDFKEIAAFMKFKGLERQLLIMQLSLLWIFYYVLVYPSSLIKTRSENTGIFYLPSWWKEIKGKKVLALIVNLFPSQNSGWFHWKPLVSTHSKKVGFIIDEMIQEYTVFQGDKVPRSWEKGGHTWGRQFLPQLGAHISRGPRGTLSIFFSQLYPRGTGWLLRHCKDARSQTDKRNHFQLPERKPARNMTLIYSKVPHMPDPDSSRGEKIRLK